MRKVLRSTGHDWHRAATTDRFPEIRHVEECDDNMHCDFGEKQGWTRNYAWPDRRRRLPENEVEKE